VFDVVWLKPMYLLEVFLLDKPIEKSSEF